MRRKYHAEAPSVSITRGSKLTLAFFSLQESGSSTEEESFLWEGHCFAIDFPYRKASAKARLEKLFRSEYWVGNSGWEMKGRDELEFY